MPKVSEEYFENKRKSIVDAAYKVCLRKPVEMVTMMDVIEETGLSQGGIYKFYKNLDDVLSDMIAGMRSDYNIIDELDEIINDKEISFEKAVHKVCDIMANVMEEHLMDIQKINFDLTVLAINEPERAENIIKNTKGRSNFEYLATALMPKLVEASETRKLKPQGDPREIISFISATYTGIEMSCILTACYGRGKMVQKTEPKPMFDMLARTIILLFGGNVNE